MDIERAVLGMCMRDSENLHRVIGMGIDGACFGENGLSDIFQALVESDAAGEGVGIAFIAPRLKPENITIALDIYEQAPLTQRVEYWAQALLDLMWRKTALKSLSGLLTEIRATDVFAGNGAIREAISALLEPTTHNPNFTDLNQALDKAMDRIDELTNGKGSEIKSGLAPIDELMGGFHPGELYVLAARPGGGKTSLSLQFAHDIARQGIPTVFVSLEMTNLELANKLLSMGARVDNGKIRKGNLTSLDHDCLYTARKIMHPWQFVIGEQLREIGRLEIGLRGLKKQGKIGFLVIDYIQLMKAAGSWKGNRVAELTEITGRIKSLAIELNIPIIILSQINRQGATQGTALPGVHNLKDSGSLEQDADAVLILHKQKNEETKEEKHFLMIAKNRHGMTGDFELRADLSLSRFIFDNGGYDDE